MDTPKPPPSGPADHFPGTPAVKRKRAARPAQPAAASVEAALHRERQRVADVLHNTVCQELTGICLMAGAAARAHHATCPEAEAGIRELARLIHEAGRGMQEFVRTLRAGAG